MPSNETLCGLNSLLDAADHVVLGAVSAEAALLAHYYRELLQPIRKGTVAVASEDYFHDCRDGLRIDSGAECFHHGSERTTTRTQRHGPAVPDHIHCLGPIDCTI